MSPEVEAGGDMEGTSDQPGSSWGGQSARPPKEAATSLPRGLAPTDLTSLPVASREIITWLARRKMATLEEMEQELDREEDSLLDTLDELRLKDYVVETLIEGVKYYRVAFHAKPRRGSRGLPQELWDRLELDGSEPVNK